MAIERPPIEEWRERAAVRPDSQAPSLYNLEAVAMLAADREFTFGHITYRVHVPFLAGLQLSEIRREFDDLVQREADDDDELDYHETASQLAELFTDSLPLIRQCVEPKNRFLRFVWRHRPKWNPFASANNADWVRVTRFLLLCRMKSGVQFPTATDGPQR